MRNIVIVGGGITGLAAGYLAAKAGNKVTVLEASSKFGGLLNTFEVGGNRLEFYYHHFFTHDSELRWLLKELGIDSKLRFHSSSMGIYRNGKIYPFDNVFDLLRFSPLSFFDKIRFGLTSIYLGRFADWRKYETISCTKWLKRWAGEGVAKNIWNPLLKVKFGIYKDRVPVSWMVGRLRQRMQSRKKGNEKLGYIEGSLQVLLDTLVSKLRAFGVEMVSEAEVTQLKIQGDQVVSIITTKGTYFGEDFLVTIPGTYLADLVAPYSGSLSGALFSVKYFGAVCTVLELDRPLSDIYWLNIAEENFPFGGVIEHTNLVSPEHYDGKHIIYLSRYFANEEPIARMNEGEIQALMIDSLSKIYPKFSDKWIQRVSVFRTNTAATVCDENFSKKVPSCKTNIRNMFVVNMAHIYPDERSANNSIRIAAEACRIMGIDTSYVPRNSSLSALIGF